MILEQVITKFEKGIIMHSIKELIEIAKNASSKFLNKTASLNESLISDLSGKNFTNEEIQRVVEFANTNTYLELRKSAENRYVDFDLADFETIRGNMPKEEAKTYIPSTHSDYNRPPAVETTVEKTAAAPITAEYDFFRDVMPAYIKDMTKLSDAVSEDLLEVDGRINKLTNGVRQILLEGGNPSDVKTLVTMVDTSGEVWRSISSKLDSEFPVIKTAEFIENKVINPESYLVKEAFVTSVLIGRAVENALAHDLLRETFLVEKEAALSKLTKGLLAGGALLTTFGLGSASGKAAKEQKELAAYSHLKPKGAL